MKTLPRPTTPRAARGTSFTVVLLCLALTTSACTSLETLRPSARTDFTTMVHVGDDVSCTLTDGTQTDITLTAVEPDALIAGNRRINRSDIAKLQMTRLDGKRTGATAVSILAGVALAGAGVASYISNLSR